MKRERPEITIYDRRPISLLSQGFLSALPLLRHTAFFWVFVSGRTDVGLARTTVSGDKYGQS